jgi:hypothetical protein
VVQDEMQLNPLWKNDLKLREHEGVCMKIDFHLFYLFIFFLLKHAMQCDVNKYVYSFARILRILIVEIKKN